MIKRIPIVLVLLCLLTPLACSKKVAEGDGWAITVDEFKEKYNSLPPEQAIFLATEEGKRKYLENLILGEILYHEAEKEGITKDQDIINQAEEARREIIINEYLKRKLQGGLAPTDAEIEKYYSENQDLFDNAKSIRVMHILVKTEEGAEKILKQLEEGEKFELLAQEYSICPSASSGGDLGYFERKEMTPEFDVAAFELKKPGDISPIVKTKFGYHIIKLVDKDHLLEAYIYDKQDLLIQRFFDEIQENTEYTVHEDNLTFGE
jgi:peptidyl-prolyl cis-trans isomerase C